MMEAKKINRFNGLPSLKKIKININIEYLLN